MSALELPKDPINLGIVKGIYNQTEDPIFLAAGEIMCKEYDPNAIPRQVKVYFPPRLLSSLKK